MLLDEYNLVVERINGLEVTRATLLQLAVSSVLSKKAGKVFDKQIKRLTVETEAYEPGDDTGE